MSITINVCIICSDADSDESNSPLIKSCTNPDCEAQAHDHCLLLDYTSGITHCKKCNCDNDMDRFKKLNLWKFIKVLLILIYRIFCILLTQTILFFMTLGKNFSHLKNSDCGSAVSTCGGVIVLMCIVSFFLSSTYFCVCMLINVHRRKSETHHWFIISLFEWSNIDYVHCYAISIILVLESIFIFICHCIGYVVNRMIFGTNDFFGWKSAMAG